MKLWSKTVSGVFPLVREKTWGFFFGPPGEWGSSRTSKDRNIKTYYGELIFLPMTGIFYAYGMPIKIGEDVNGWQHEREEKVSDGCGREQERFPDWVGTRGRMRELL